MMRQMSSLLGAMGAQPPAAGGGDGAGNATIQMLRVGIKALTAYIQHEQDEEDKAQVAQCLTILQRVLAKDQKEAAGGASSAVASGPSPGAGPPGAPHGV